MTRPTMPTRPPMPSQEQWLRFLWIGFCALGVVLMICGIWGYGDWKSAGSGIIFACVGVILMFVWGGVHKEWFEDW